MLFSNFKLFKILKCILIILLSIEFCSAQNNYIVSLINSKNATLYHACVPTIKSENYRFSVLANNIQYENIYVDELNSFCKPPVSDYKNREAVLIDEGAEKCDLKMRLTNAHSSGVKILIISSKIYTDLPNVPSNVTTILMNRTIWNLYKNNPEFFKSAKVGVYGLISKNLNAHIATSATLASIIVVTIILIVIFAIYFHKEMLSIFSSKRQSIPPNCNGGMCNVCARCRGINGSVNFESLSVDDTKSLKWLVIIMPIVSVGMLLLLYFFYNIMVWVVIVFFYIFAAVQFADVLMLFFLKFQMFPFLVIEINKYKLTTIDVRRVILIVVGFVISTVWIVNRNNLTGLIVNDIIGVYLCLGIALAVGSLLAFSKKFKVVLAIMVVILIVDAVMVFSAVDKTNVSSTKIMPYRLANETSSSAQLHRIRRSPAKGLSSIMEEVALGTAGTNKEEIPIRFKMPVFDLTPHPLYMTCYVSPNGYSLMGFGDVILPGLFITFMLTFAVSSKSKVWLYSIVSLFGYISGMVLTFLVLYLTGKGQPALIYLIPFTVLPNLLVALIVKDFWVLWAGNWGIPTETAGDHAYVAPAGHDNESMVNQDQLLSSGDMGDNSVLMESKKTAI